MRRAVISVEKGTVKDFLDIVKRSPVADKPNAVDIVREAAYRSIEVRQGLVNGEPQRRVRLLRVETRVEGLRLSFDKAISHCFTCHIFFRELAAAGQRPI